jgi:hypothetical protein
LPKYSALLSGKEGEPVQPVGSGGRRFAQGGGEVPGREAYTTGAPLDLLLYLVSHNFSFSLPLGLEVKLTGLNIRQGDASGTGLERGEV